MAKGRKTPTVIKKLQGTLHSRDRAGSQVRFTAVAALPDPPAYFGEVARQEWHQVGAQLIGSGLLELPDLVSLEGYCYAKQVMAEAGAKLQSEGLLVEYTNKAKETNTIVSPAWKLYRDALEKVQSVAARFGFDPVSRAKVNAPAQHSAQQLHPFEEALLWANPKG